MKLNFEKIITEVSTEMRNLRTLLDSAKGKLKKLLAESETSIFDESSKDEPLVDLLCKMKGGFIANDLKASEDLVDDLLTDLKHLPLSYTSNNYSKFIEEIETVIKIAHRNQSSDRNFRIFGKELNNMNIS